MKRKKHSVAGLVIVLLIAAAVLLVRHFHIRDFCIVRPGVLYTSDQPRGMDYFRLLYKYHIATIVNLRPTLEHTEQNWHTEEIVWTRNNGVKYVEMPIERSKSLPDEQAQDQFLAIMADRTNLPVLLHGAGDDKRVAMLVAVWLERSEGYAPADAAELIRKIIDDRDLTKEENEFIHSVTK